MEFYKTTKYNIYQYQKRWNDLLSSPFMSCDDYSIVNSYL